MTNGHAIADFQLEKLLAAKCKENCLWGQHTILAELQKKLLSFPQNNLFLVRHTTNFGQVFGLSGDQISWRNTLL